MQKPSPEESPEFQQAETEFAEDQDTTDAATIDQASDANAALIEELTSDLQRTRADFENFRKQVDTQKTQAMQVAKYATVEKFLPLLDDLNRAIATYPDQLKPLEKNFQKLLQSLNLKIIETSPGVEFNPDYHEAISIEDGEGDREVIIETLRPGYTYDGSVLRAAMVKVGHA